MDDGSLDSRGRDDGGETPDMEEDPMDDTLVDDQAAGMPSAMSWADETTLQSAGATLEPMVSSLKDDHHEDTIAAMTQSTEVPAPAGPESKWLADFTRSIQPDSQHTWASNTLHGLEQAKSLLKEAHQQVRRNNEDTSYSASKHACRVQHHIKVKMGVTNDLNKALEDRIESVEDTIRQVGECLFQLQRAQRAKWAPLNVAERRLELRDTRPLRELVRDHLTDALEHERQTLIEARHELADHIESAKEMLTTLDALKCELTEDLHHMRHAVRTDRAVLIPAIKPDALPIASARDRFSAHHLPDISHFSRPTTPKDGMTDNGREGEARSLLTRVVQQEERAMRLCNACDAVMIHTKQECQKASAQSVASMTRRTSETLELKRKLEEHIQETDATIATVERSLSRTNKELHAHRELLRKQVALLEHQSKLKGMQNMVGDTLMSQLNQAKGIVTGLSSKSQETTELLQKLRAARQDLVEDLKCKTKALRIDDACLKVTPKKAIELDRTDPRGGRCQAPSRRPAPNSARGHGSPQALLMAGASMTGDGRGAAGGDRPQTPDWGGSLPAVPYASAPMGLGGYERGPLTTCVTPVL